MNKLNLNSALGALFTLEPSSFNSKKREVKEENNLEKEVEKIFKKIKKGEKK